MPTEECKKKLLLEYSQFRELRKLLDWLHQRTKEFAPNPHRNQAVKTENQFGRWLMTVQFISWQNMDERFPLLPRVLDSRSRAEFAKFFHLSYPGMTRDYATGLVESLQLMIDQFRQEGDLSESAESFEPEVRYDESNGCGRISVGEFSTPQCQRLKALVEKCGELRTALMCLRYHGLGLFKGCESSLGARPFKALFEFGDVRHEGFASPLNCQLLDRPGAEFCSLFQDTDSEFGSLGNFFRINLKEHPGGWVLSPPFVEPLLEAVARRVVDLLDETEPGAFWFFIVFPEWTDCEGWKMLDNSPWKVDRNDFSPNQLALVDCYGSKLSQQTTICLFAMGELPDHVNLATLRDRMMSA